MPKKGEKMPAATRQKVSKTKERYTPEEVIEALQASFGRPASAAKKLGCHYETILRYIREYAEVARAKKLIDEELGDEVEENLLSLVRKKNTAATIFYCKTKLRHRGYVEKVQVEVIPITLQQQLATLCERHGVEVEDVLKSLIDAFPTEGKQVGLLSSGEANG